MKTWRPQLDRALTLAIVIGFLIQFALGMVINLYVTLPSRHPGAKASDYFSGVAAGVPWAIAHTSWALAIHAALGGFLGLAAVGLLVLAIRARERRRITTTLLGAVFTIAAGFNGRQLPQLRTRPQLTADVDLLCIGARCIHHSDIR